MKIFGRIISFFIIPVVFLSIVSTIFISLRLDLFRSLYTPLIFLNAFSLFAMLGVILFELFQVLRSYQSIGVRFLMRLLRAIVFLVLLPISILYIFSLFALNANIDRLFNVEVEQLIEDATKLSDKTLDIFYLEAIEKTEQIFSDLSNFDFYEEKNFSTFLDKVRLRYAAYEVSIFLDSSVAVFFSTKQLEKIQPIPLNFQVTDRLLSSENYVNIEKYKGKSYIRVAKEFYRSPLNVVKPYILQVIFDLSDQIQELRDKIHQTKLKYSKEFILKGELRSFFIFNLFLVLLLGLLLGIWITILFAKRISNPIFELAKATNRVSRGDYTTQIRLNSYDEFEQLADSFNYMIDQISYSQKKTLDVHQKEEAQRMYLDNLFSQLSVGVLVFRKNGVLVSCNSVGERLFSKPFCYLNQPIEEIKQRIHFNWLNIIAGYLSHVSWQHSMLTETIDGFKHLVFRGKDFPFQTHNHHIIVFEDVTDLVFAQKQAAWVEVAKRLAHEIKNPLTPIQLTAQRMQLKYSKYFSESDLSSFQDSIQTIIEQVQLMKTMVNEFAQYARNKPFKFQKMDLNLIINSAVMLYEGGKNKITLNLDDDLPNIYLSQEHIRQIIFNLIKNSIEAKEDVSINISSYLMDNDQSFVVFELQDNGPGIEAEKASKIFEPYFTSKEKGTGLGLAIVKKIVDEHQAQIKIKTHVGDGFLMMIQFPLELK